VIHHGGSGTTGAGLRAGKPTLICPFLGDQPFWGHQVYRLGAGPPPLPQRRLTAPGLRESINELLSTPGYQRNASEIGQKIRAEHGVREAVNVLTSIHEQSRQPRHG
jgi:sterol 3beta-glucosyltransferase